ncbi:MAG: hypothetical protein K2P67_01910 [Gallionellaceae bacterium]|nr:hypothetical protein [Gallionellaceae bacterium]
MSAFWIVVIIALVAWGFFKFGQSKPQQHEIVIRTEFKTFRSESASAEDDPGIAGEEKDNWEKFDFYSSRTIPAQGSYRISYVDQNGLATERVITVKHAYQDANGNFAVDAHCHLRNAHRSFIDSRIKSAVEFKTGEIVESVAKHAIAQYEDSGAGKSIAAIEREWMAVQLLAYVCRADGKMMKAERYIVADYLKRRCRDLVVNNPAELDNAIKTIGEPDQRGFRRIIADMKAAGDIDRLRDITDCAKRIVATQKTIDPMEAAAIELLEAAAK